MLRRLLLIVPGLWMLAAYTGRAATPAAPPPPATYDVVIRYRINAFPRERIPQYSAMMRTLKRLGFVRDPDEVVPETEAEDAKYTTLRGTIPSAKARLLLTEPHVQTILLGPHGEKPPAAGTPVRVDLTLASGMSGRRPARWSATRR